MRGGVFQFFIRLRAFRENPNAPHCHMPRRNATKGRQRGQSTRCHHIGTQGQQNLCAIAAHGDRKAQLPRGLA